MTSIRVHAALAVSVLLVTACGGSGGGGTPGTGGSTGPTGGTGGTSLTGIPLPKEVSALPTGSAASGATSLAPVVATADAAGALTPPAGSDYALAKTCKFVSEDSLSRFDVLNVVFDALGQTHYDDAAVLNQGPYAAMVTWEDKGDQGQNQKMLLRWVVDSTRASSTAPNVVLAWFQMPMKDMVATIQARIVISEAPRQAADGSYTDYGVWTMNVRTFENSPFRFVASAERDAQGRAVVKMSQAEPSDLGPSAAPNVTRGILIRSAQAGSGKVSYPDWQTCNAQPCSPQTSNVVYAYDPDVVTLQKNALAPTTKSRGTFVDVVNRYGLYDATTGEDVNRKFQFGFPIRATVGGSQVFGYYGAWQGRHQLWANGQSVPEGLTVTRADVAPGQAAATYVTTAPFVGILVKRTYVNADLSDLVGRTLETWDNRSFPMVFDGARWCTDPVPQSPPPGAPPDWKGPMICGPSSPAFTDWASLEVADSDVKRFVSIGTWDQANNRQLNFVYLANGPGGPGLYEALVSGGGGRPVAIGQSPYPFAANANVWVNVGGSIYLAYDGAVWHRLVPTGFDPQTWTPTFADATGVPFVPQDGREYYLNSSGTNYVATVAGGSVTLKLEIQTVANPANAAALVPDGTVFAQPWCSSCSTFEFVTSPASPAFMKLVYRTLGDGEKGSRTVGAVVENGIYGLQATVGGSPVAFNWDYPQQGQQFGPIQQYLRSGSDFVLLHDPLQLPGVTATNGSGSSRVVTVQFDGQWMQGLPNVWEDLQRSGFQATPAIAEKNYAVATGTEVGGYVVKQLQVSEYMAPSSAAPLDLAAARGVDLSTVPAFVDPGMGAMPDAPLRYSEGKPVDPR